MAEKIQAYCGLVCSECEAYLATQANDLAQLEAVAAKWSQEFAAEMTVESVTCDGCPTDTRLGSYCGMCPIRACARERNVAVCAYCDDYGCEIVQEFFKAAPHMEATLNEMRQTWLAGRA